MNAILNYMAESIFVGLVLYLMLRLSAFKSWDYSFQRIVALVSVMAIALFPLLRITINDPLIAGYVLDPAYALSGGTMEDTQENTSGTGPRGNPGCNVFSRLGAWEREGKECKCSLYFPGYIHAW
jgi:hypothetical protein